MSTELRPTPETDAAKFDCAKSNTATQWVVSLSVAQRIERQRDGLLAALWRLKTLADKNPYCPIGLAFEHCEPALKEAIAGVKGEANEH